ncbi:RidA family protein [Enorma burkinafasonensis]|uniref:RidA family protein n=1 Tax=Enorma burkinafasonensis TaxID=2590867 RepID=UPI0026EBAD7A|nr:RidA family protein [Enorma burkinafasonensis]MCI7730886.1 RidA family protein [Enorma burkinafasonensis]
MDKHVIASENAPAALGPYSAGIATGNLAFLSGQLGLDPATGELAQGVVAQAEQALKNIEALLAAAGATFGNVVKTTVFLADIADFDAVNEVYGAHFTEPYPARSAVQVAALPKGALVEIECIVAL